MKKIIVIICALFVLILQSCGKINSVEELKNEVSGKTFVGQGEKIGGKKAQSHEKEITFNADGTISGKAKTLRTDKETEISGKWEAKKCKFAVGGEDFYYIKITDNYSEMYLVWWDGNLVWPYDYSSKSHLTIRELDGCLYLTGDTGLSGDSVEKYVEKSDGSFSKIIAWIVIIIGIISLVYFTRVMIKRKKQFKS